MGRRALVVDWNGKDLPRELRELPAGRYMVEPINDVAFTDEEERGIEQALAQVRQGHTVDGDQARTLFETLL
jgi:hypothetical protein